jgi:hypothetical protein
MCVYKTMHMNIYIYLYVVYLCIYINIYIYIYTHTNANVAHVCVRNYVGLWDSQSENEIFLLIHKVKQPRAFVVDKYKCLV